MNLLSPLRGTVSAAWAPAGDAAVQRARRRPARRGAAAPRHIEPLEPRWLLSAAALDQAPVEVSDDVVLAAWSAQPALDPMSPQSNLGLDASPQLGGVRGLKWSDANANGQRDDATLGGGEDGEPAGTDAITLAPIGPVILARSDDDSTSPVDFGFTFEFYGADYDQFYINNNGNISFTRPLTDFIPDGFPQDLPIVAPFWADVDTRPQGSAEVHLARGASDRGNPFIQVDWPGVGYFANHVDKLNHFTLYIEDDPGGDIVAFFYGQMQWTTGDVEGAGGFGGDGAQIGFDGGDGVHFISLGRPSRRTEIAQFAHTSSLFRTDPSGVPVQGREEGVPGVIIYLDLNENGQLDGGEPSTITLEDDPDTREDEAGRYELGNAAPGTYLLREVVPEGSSQTFPVPVAGDPDSDGHRVTIGSGVILADRDFGNAELGSIGGAKFEDHNANGLRDQGEPGLAGWTIFVDADADGLRDDGETSAVTGADGAYVLEGLRPGTHRVAEQLQNGWVPSMSADNTHLVELALGEDVGGLDFGNYRPAEIRGAKFEDHDADGLRDDADQGLADWTIFLDANANGRLDEGETSTRTDADGRYAFAGLVPGAYRVVEVLEAGWTASSPAEGPAWRAVTLVSGDVAADLDLANFRAGRIEGTKWNDLDGDGVRDAGEPPLAAATVFVDADGDGQLDAGENSAVTGADGQYLFTLRPGAYSIAEVRPDHWYQSFPLGGIHAVDETAAHAQTLTSGQTAAGLDFGNFRLGAISGTAEGTIDPDAGGPEEATDVGVPGFVLFLDADANGLLDEDEPFEVSGADGRYRLDDLLPGTYTVAQQDRALWLPGGPPGNAPRQVSVARGEQVQDVDFLSLPDGPDLLGTVDVQFSTATLVPGTRGWADVVAANLGTEPLDETVAIDLYFSTDQSLDGADHLVASIPGQRLRLDPGQTRRLRLSFQVGQDMPADLYFLLADIDATQVAAETIDANNVAASDVATPFAWLFGDLPGGPNVSLNVLDSAGTPVRFTLTGGMGRIVGEASFEEIVLSGTTAGSALGLAVTERGATTTIHGLTVGGSLGSIRAPDIELGPCSVHVSGTLRSATFGNVSGPTTILVDHWDGERSLSLALGEVADLSIVSAAPLGLLSAANIADLDGEPDSVQAPWIDRLLVQRNLDADLTLTSTAARQSIRSAVIGGWLENSTVLAPRDIGSLDVGGLRRASVYAGLRPDFLADEDQADSGLPGSADDFLNHQATIGRLIVRGQPDQPYAMIDSNVAAWFLRQVSLRGVWTPGSATHGVAAHRIGTYYRQRNSVFSPTTRNLSGPAVVDAVDRFVALLIGTGRA